MFRNSILFFIALVLASGQVNAQTCGGLGQNPGSAFPVCGTAVFEQQNVPVCGGKQIPTRGCDDFLTDVNPYWYRFTCFKSGTFSFSIIPKNLGDDYDWQLFDITGHNPSDVYTDPSLFVACNWSGEPGATGASSAGAANSLIVCGSSFGGPYRPLFTAMPTLEAEHEYVMLVSHFSGSDQSGYNLSFGNDTTSTAVITDTTQPGLGSARAICDGTRMTVKLKKKMKCSSLNADGSDFTISPAIAPIIAAEGVDCSGQFDMDSIVLTLGAPLPPGVYQIAIKTDVSGINLLDNCNRVIPADQTLPVTVYPLFPTPMDSISPVGCAPDELQLVFNKPMLCSSIAADGSDFIISGGSGLLKVSGATGICSSGELTNVIRVKLEGPVQLAGRYRVTLTTGKDGNTVYNECGLETPAGSFLSFVTKDTVNAEFTYKVSLGCKTDTIQYLHDGRNGVNSWHWTFDNGITSNAKDTAITYNVFNTKTAQLTVSNGVCNSTSAVASIILDNSLKAIFESTAVVCPGDPAVFKDNSLNRVKFWDWSFGNSGTSNLQTPAPQYYQSSSTTKDLPVKLIVTNDIGCSDTAVNTIRVVANCYIAIPKAFTPNGDGLNDFLYPTNAYKAKDLYFAVYNRVGQKLFETRDWTNKWDGTFKGNPQDPGTYVWILNYTHIETGQRFNLKGATVLIR